MNQKPLILVADNDHEIRWLVQYALELEGYATIGAEDGKAALDAAREQSPDLVILDVTMPGLDGFQVLEKLRTCSEAPVIMLTARADVQSAVKALTLGADDYVRKPFIMRELIERVRIKLWRTSR